MDSKNLWLLWPPHLFQKSALWDRKTFRLRSSLDGPQARKFRAYLPWKSRSRDFSPPTTVMVAGDGIQWWLTCLWDLVQLLQQLCLQETLILGCGLFQLRLEIFRPRGERQLGNSLAMSAIETEPTLVSWTIQRDFTAEVIPSILQERRVRVYLGLDFFFLSF